MSSRYLKFSGGEVKHGYKHGYQVVQNPEAVTPVFGGSEHAIDSFEIGLGRSILPIAENPFDTLDDGFVGWFRREVGRVVVQAM
jgi:hypothetical protein